MKISVITVCRNSEDSIADTLASVKDQDWGNIEHIVIDGASTDKTLSILENYRNPNLKVSSELDSGIYDAMNKGINIATGDIIGFLNSDDVFENSAILSKIADAMSDQSVDACYGNLVYVDRKNLSKVIRLWISRDFKRGLFKRGWVPPHPTFYARKSVYQRFGNFDTQIKQAADFDILLRFLEVCSIKAKFMPHILVRMRVGGATSKNIIGQNIEIARSFKKYDLKVSYCFFIYKFSNRIYQYLAGKLYRE